MGYHPQPNIEVNYLITPSEPPEIKRVKYSIQNTFKVLCANYHKMTNKKKSGELYNLELIISPILDTKGDILFFVGIEV